MCSGDERANTLGGRETGDAAADNKVEAGVGSIRRTSLSLNAETRSGIVAARCVLPVR